MPAIERLAIGIALRQCVGRSLPARAEAGIDGIRVPQLQEIGVVVAEMLRLDPDRFLPGKAQPGEVPEYRRP